MCRKLKKQRLSAHSNPRRPDRLVLYRRAEQQAGYFTAKQAAAAGFSRHVLWTNTRSGRFLRVSRGVYRLVQFPASPLEDLFVAWLRCGPKSVISHDSALAVYDLSGVIPGEVHVTVPRSASRRRPGIQQHTKSIDPAEITNREGLPVTSVSRTIADVASAGLPEEHVGEAIRDALREGLADRKALLRGAQKRGGRAALLIVRFLRDEAL